MNDYILTPAEKMERVVERLREENARLRAKLATVVEVVKRIHVSDHGYCSGCGGEWVSQNEWPCETLQKVMVAAKEE